MGNSVIFPAPKERRIPFYMESHLHFLSKPHRDEDRSESSNSFLFFCCSDRKITKKIPYLYFREDTEPKKSKYLMIYFHGNSELLSHSFKALERYHAVLRIPLLAAEYPGYGFYENEAPSEQTVLEDAELVIAHCMKTYGYQEENIILMGRSLGTGVVAQMGVRFPKLRGLIMISPYLSIRDVAKNMVGGFMSNFVPDVFKTKEIIEQLQPPVLFLHGLRDRLVPCTNSSYLYDRCNSPKMLNLSATMDHNKVDFRLDLYLPMLKFFMDKLEMVEFQEDYDGEEVDRVSALSSLDKSHYRSPSSNRHNGKGYNFETSLPPTDIPEEKELEMD